MRKNFTVLLILISIFVFPVLQAQIQSPEQFLGYRVGADYKIADYETIAKYFKLLASTSGRVKYVPVGATTQGREMFMAVISSDENMKNLPKYQNIAARLSDPRTLSDSDSKQLAKEGKSIILVTCNIHSTEIASSQMSMELAFDLATTNTPADLKILNDVIFLIMPSINPDGTTMVKQWYDKYVHTEYEGIGMPYLYHEYAGHDDNRDYFMFNLVETRNVIDVAYHQWHPQIWLDEHQMGSDGARLFLVPYKDPLNPNISPMIWRWQALIGGFTALRLQQQNMTGIINSALFEGWWEGPASDCGMWHNQIALLSEMASCATASPIYIDPSEVKATDDISTYDIRYNYTSPWKGGWWRLRNIVDYELSLTHSLLELGSQFKEELLLNYYGMAKDAIHLGESASPFAYVVPRDQRDPVTTSKMIELLQMGGVEVHYSEQPFTVGNTNYPAHSYILYLGQPNGRYLKDLMEEQRYPDLRRSRKDPMIEPYDVAGWTMPYLMGVQFSLIEKPFRLETTLLTNPNYQVGVIPTGPGKYLVAPAGLNVNAALINRLHKAGIEVRLSSRAATVNGKEYRPGSIIVSDDAKTVELLTKSEADLHICFDRIGNFDGMAPRLLKKVRVGLYQPTAFGSMDEGWTRLLLKNYEFDFTSVHNKDIKTKDIKSRYDVIIIPDISRELLKTGKYSGEGSRPSRPRPPEYEGGIEKEGVENLKTFVEKDGGTLITFGDANEFAIQDLGVRVSNVLRNVKSEDFFCPGSLVRIKTDPSIPLCYGMDEESIGYLTSSIAFATSTPSGLYDRTIAVRFPDSNLLKSGFLQGEDYIFNRAAVVDVKQVKGHIILNAISVQSRDWTHGTFPIFFNSILTAGLE